MGLTLAVRPGDRGTVVRVNGDVDVNAAGSLPDLLLEIMRAHDPAILLDLSGVSFMDCAGLRALLAIRRRAERCRGSIRVIAESPAVHRIINLTMVRDVFPVFTRVAPQGDNVDGR
ncbi:MAG: STAS domain-containing protein [Actinomycetota bacterium]|nr:STAS domain-containing protein [Actinomycetota bacterium]